MTPTSQLTNTQERKFYRQAVQASLEKFYGKSHAEATKLVQDWWRRLSETGVSQTGLYLHSEPINTAAGIARAEVVQITEKNRAAYHRVLNRSRNLAIVTSSAKKVPYSQVSNQEQREQEAIQYVSSASSSIGKTLASKALAKRAKNKNASAKQRIAVE